MKNGQTIGQWLNWDFKTNGVFEIKDRHGNCIYFEYSNGYWSKYQYDSQGNIIYSENSNGIIMDNRTPKNIETDDLLLKNKIISLLFRMHAGDDCVGQASEKLFNLIKNNQK